MGDGQPFVRWQSRGNGGTLHEQQRMPEGTLITCGYKCLQVTAMRE